MKANGTKANVTIVEVARAAGVSPSTVSHVINSTRWVNPDTAEAVRAAISSTGYRPNTLARSLARKSSSSVGIALSTSANPFFNEVAGTIEKACTELGLMVFLADTEERPERELEVVKALHGMQVSGIILAPCTAGFNESIDYLKLHAVPTVLVDRLSANSPFDFVASENGDAIAELVGLLVENGHRRIGIVVGQTDFSSSSERVEGYRVGLARAGIPFDPALVVENSIEIGAGAEAVTKVLASKSAPTAIIGGNNLSTIAIVSAARQAGLDIPGQLSVVGFDDFDWADYFEPRLTLMAQPWRDIGQKASELLLRRVNGETGDAETIRCKPELKMRGSIRRIG